MEISKELDQQNKMLENVNTDFEEAIGGLDAVTKKTQELIKKSGEGMLTSAPSNCCGRLSASMRLDNA